MIQPELLKSYFPAYLYENRIMQKYMVKEYLQLLILDFLTTTPFIRKIIFIGGTNLRLTKGIDRFSEDLDFDCKGLSHDEFIQMTEGVIGFLQRYGLRVETRDKPNDKLKAFRRNLFFPELLFELGLSGYRQERFLIKIESQDQQIDYAHKMATIKGCGLFFSFPVPTDEVLCSMKISALLSRQKGRDFYDTLFLMGLTTPDYIFLKAKCGIANLNELKAAFETILLKVDLIQKAKDFKHLVFNEINNKRILLFGEFVKGL